MLAFVLIFNSALALLCLVAAWQFWRLRRILAKATRIINRAERGTQRVLAKAPRVILKGQTGVLALQDKLQALEPHLVRLQQLQKLLGLVSLGQRALRPSTLLRRTVLRR